MRDPLWWICVAILVVCVMLDWFPWRWLRRAPHSDLAAARRALLWIWDNSYLYECPPVEVSLAVKAAQEARKGTRERLR